MQHKDGAAYHLAVINSSGDVAMETTLTYWVGAYGSSNISIMATMVYLIACAFMALHLFAPQKEDLE